MKTSLKPFAQKVGLSLLYALIVLAYCSLYAPFGLENNDGGFILGLSHQFSVGSRLYNDIIYVRPPASIIFHSISFAYPLDIAPVFSSRIVYFLQISVYSVIVSALLARHFSFTPLGVFFLASASFIFNTHNFPPMAWHTVDGVFFSVIAVYFATTLTNSVTAVAVLKGFLAFLFAYTAALSKQPYYITPLLVAVVMVYPFTKKRASIALLTALAGCIFTYSILASLLDVDQMLDAISSQVNLRDLISAGVVNYARDWYHVRAIVTAGPLAAVLLIWAYLRVNEMGTTKLRYLSAAFTASLAIFILSILQMFLMTDRWVSPRNLIDSIFTVTALISVIEVVRTREREWVILTALHAISWAASISWGYSTVALFSSPSLIVFAIASREVFSSVKLASLGAVGAISASALAFYYGNQFLYSLEGPVRRLDASVSVGSEFPALYGVYVTETEAAALRELAALRYRLGNNIVVAPNWPLYNVIFGGKNPIGVDWLLNTEVGPYEQAIKSRLGHVGFVIVFRNASPSPSSEGRFGSRITQGVMQNWTLEDRDGEYFDVYANPRIDTPSSGISPNLNR